MVNLIVVYECPARKEGAYKLPDVPEHAYRWRVNDMKMEYGEDGSIKEYFVVKSEMAVSEFEKIKDSVKVIKVMQL